MPVAHGQLHIVKVDGHIIFYSPRGRANGLATTGVQFQSALLSLIRQSDATTCDATRPSSRPV